MKRRGFTLIELLTVIAIIGILSAILFPVFNTAKKNAKKSADMSNMGSIYQALKLYREDQGGYPPLLLGVVEYNSGLRQSVENVRRGFLYRSRIKDVTTFASVLANQPRNAEITNVVWPHLDPRPLAGGETCDTRQWFGRPLAWDQSGCPGMQDVVRYNQIGYNSLLGINNDMVTDPARFYPWDTYDTAPSIDKDAMNNPLRELRYTLFWTKLAQVSGGGPNDNPRQLGYDDPRDDTVVTWNTYYQDVTNGTPNLPRNTRSAVVLFLNGTVRVVDARDVYERSWRFGQ